MRVLVTGAAGFIGSHLLERLVDDGHQVRAFVHYNGAGLQPNLDRLPRDVYRELEVVAGDVADPYRVDRAVTGCQWVFHLAALIGIPYSYEAAASYVATNVSGTLNILQASLRHQVERVVHTSTSEVYGSAQYVPIDEAHPLVGQSPYSASKIAADKLAESFWCSFNLPVVTVRPFNTFGPRQSARAVIPTILSQASASSEPLRLGSLDPIRDLTYVEDTVAGFVAAAQATGQVPGQVFNLGVGSGVSIGELVELAGRLLGRRLEVACDSSRVRPDRSEVSRLISNNQRARQMLGWEPRVSLEEGLARTLDYVRSHLGDYKTETYAV